MIPLDELRHLVEGSRSGELVGGLGLVRVDADGSEPEEILARCRQLPKPVTSEVASLFNKLFGRE